MTYLPRARALLLAKRGLPIATATILLLQGSTTPLDLRRPSISSSVARKVRTRCESLSWSSNPTGLGGRQGSKYPAAHSDHPASRLPTTKYRTRQTEADAYFRQHGQIPLPPVIHASLPAPADSFVQPVQDDKAPSSAAEGEKTSMTRRPRQGILVIGDVHGCWQELQVLHQQAVAFNDGCDFEWVLLVGDLCNKGPDSVRVIQQVRTTPRWRAVRGNHDDGALAAALGDPSRLRKKKYQWIHPSTLSMDDNEEEEEEDDDDPSSYLTDEDVAWMAQLPYTIRIPGAVLGDAQDTVIVHAGLIPQVDLADQTIETMISVREVEQHEDGHYYLVYPKKKSAPLGMTGSDDSDTALSKSASSRRRYPWAELWKGPFRVVFGHDARRGLQQFTDPWALGLDTGACYGGKLTGVILPQRRIVQVEATAVHTPAGQDLD